MQPLPPPPKTKGRFIVELESARGFAAFLVAGVHCAHTPILINGTTTELRQVVETGWFWKLLHWLHEELVLGHYELHRSVVFFFVLSGFLLTASLQEGPTAVGRAAVRFSIGRFFRIYPAIVAAIFVFWMAYEIAGLSLLPGAFTADSIVRNLLLLRTNIDGVMWTLQVEVVALPLIFGAFILMPRLGLVPVTITAIALFGLSFWGAWDRLNLTGSKQLFPFMIGIAGFHLG